MDKKIDITSTALEKGIDIAKNFLDKLIMPAVEETGLLLKDQVTRWRFNNQVKMLNKTKVYCEQHRIDPKTISLKLLVPLLDYSGLEEDEALQDKWSILLGNMVDSDQNVENHVFPYILSQISKNEFDLVDEAFRSKRQRIALLRIELRQFIIDRPSIEATLKKDISELQNQIEEFKGYEHWSKRQELNSKMREFENDLRSIGYKENSYRYKIEEPEEISSKDVQEFEISNLIRLGVVKEVREAYANSQTLEIPNEPDKSYLVFELDVEVESNDSYVLTELGELFVQACTQKAI